MEGSKFPAGRLAANSEGATTSFSDQLLARALAQQLVGSSESSTWATPRMEQSRVNLMEQLQIMQMQQPNSMLGGFPHLIQDDKRGSTEGTEPNVSRLLNSLQGFGTSILPESRPGIDSKLMQQLNLLEENIYSTLQKKENQTEPDCVVSGIQAQHHQQRKLDKVATKDKASDKDSSPVIAPCPARGMPIDHNFKVSLLL